MAISFAVCTHNERGYIRTLIDQLTAFIETNERDDEIVVLDDLSDNKETLDILVEIAEHPCATVYRRKFAGDFGAHKNYLNGLCKGDFIFQIDADERLTPALLSNLSTIISSNPEVDLFFIPRINTVEGLTKAHVDAWSWKVNERGWIQWPDYQSRLFRRKPNIMWSGKVHERIVGFSKYAYLPPEESYSIIHHKTIQRQETQNAFYSQLQS